MINENEVPKNNEAEKIADFLCGAAPNDDGLWFNDASEAYRGAFWWRKPLRKMQELQTNRISELEATLHIYEGRNGQPVSSTGMVDEMADALKQKDKRIAELEAERDEQVQWVKDLADDVIKLEAKLAKAMELLVEYRTKTPLGHQPHMIAHRADAIIADLRATPE